ncbi:MAG: DUF1622 domain-containing protein [Anaerolineae bacterium]|jgi:uncharacterized membrane protein
MLSPYFAGDGIGETVLQWIDWASLIIELVAVLIIVVAIVNALARYAVRASRRTVGESGYQQLKESLGKALLLGLEVLVAADVVRTVALEATLQSVVVLGLLVLIRTFLSWALVVEIEGRWPWQRERPD